MLFVRISLQASQWECIPRSVMDTSTPYFMLFRWVRQPIYLVILPEILYFVATVRSEIATLIDDRFERV